MGISEKENNGNVNFTSFIVTTIIVFSYVVFLSDNLFNFYYHESFGFYFNSFLLVICFILQGVDNKKYSKNEIFYIKYIIIFCVYIVISSFLINSGLRYVGTVFNTLVLIFIGRKCRWNKDELQIILTTIFIVLIYWCLKCSNYYIVFRQKENAINSNYIALMAVSCVIHSFLCIDLLGWWNKSKLLRLFVLAMSFYIIYECQSRGELLAWLGFVVLFYCMPKRIYYKKTMLRLVRLIISCSVLFTFIYVKVIGDLGFYFLGKRTSTRLRLWAYYYDNIFSSLKEFLIGHGTHAELKSIFGYGSFHNIYLSIFWSIGLIGFIMFYFFILKVISDRYDNSPLYHRDYIILAGFLSYLIGDNFSVTITGPLIIWNYFLLSVFLQKDEKILLSSFSKCS